MLIKITTKLVNHQPMKFAIIEHDNKVYTETAETINQLLNKIIKLNLC